MAVLPTVTPRHAAALTGLLYLPLARRIWLAPKPELFPVYVALGNAVAFAAGWHVRCDPRTSGLACRDQETGVRNRKAVTYSST